ncbi:MAG TPA: hypothetical protein VGY53_12915, partial [Isosphaeraceae bacterium]|nr:hypothetical protein [Isosphaeraceae bacterium]
LIAAAINLCWHFYRAWMPKMLRDQYGFSRGASNYFTSAFYVAADIGCIAAGVAVKSLAARGWTVHQARVVAYLACGLLTALSTVVAALPAGPPMNAVLLLIAAGALGLFPIYYSLAQELSAHHQGKVSGCLACIAWLSSALWHRQIGRWVDRAGSYNGVTFLSGLLPLVAFLFLFLFWDWPARQAHSASERGEPTHRS